MENDLNVKDIRSNLQVTQAQLAEALGIDQSTVSDWEKGRHKPRGPAKKLLLTLKPEDFSTSEASDQENAA